MSVPDSWYATLLEHSSRRFGLLKKLHAEGCPTTRCNDGSRTRQGCAVCVYCRAIVDDDTDHSDDCLWLEIVREVTE